MSPSGEPPFFEVIYGINPVRECLRAARRGVYKIFISKRKGTSPFKDILSIARKRGIKIYEVERGEVNKISGVRNHQGVVAKVDIFLYTPLNELLKRKGKELSFLLALDGIVDPHNLGAILRTAAVCQVDGVLIPQRRSSSINSTVTKVSAGAVEFLDISRVTNLPETLERLKKIGFWIVGIDEKAKEPLYNFKWNSDIVVVIGGEEKGIRAPVKRKCDFSFSIPTLGPVKTLNASVAGGIIIYEMLRQRMISLK